MWVKLAKFILKNRLLLLGAIGVITLIMGFFAVQTKLNYSFPKILPSSHPISQEYLEFKNQYGEDGNLMVIGFQKEDLFNRAFFNDLYDLGNELKKRDGVIGLVSPAHVFNLVKDTAKQRFKVVPLIENKVASDLEMDSIATLFKDLPFYQNLIYNPESNAYLMGITFEQELLDSKARIEVVEGILETTDAFADKHSIDLHYSGLPFIRSFQITKLSSELLTFLLLATLFIAILLFILYRSFATVAYPLLVVGISVVWAIGSIGLMGYKISLLTGLIPTLVVVIGIPNCVYLLNKYNEEFRKHGSKEQALTQMIARIGHVTFFANLTTSIGFGVFALMESEMLREFGLVAGLNILGTYVISLIVIPVIFSYIRKPSERHLKYLDRPFFKKTLGKLVRWTSRYTTPIQLTALGILLVAFWGLGQLKSQGYLFDDVKPSSKAYKDLKFFERNFGGVMPLDVLVDTRKKGGVTSLGFMKKLRKVHGVFEKDSLFSRPLSLVDGIEFSTQAYYNGKPQFYDLPSNLEKNFVFTYLKNSGSEGSNNLLKTMTDSAQQVARISVTMADVGSGIFPKVIDGLHPQITSILDTSRYDVKITGTSLVALEGYNYLINGLIYSVLLAFFLIACIIAFLFRSWRMLLIALLPNIIPLAVTASIMGYWGIALKPSTVLIFSVAFGISVDFTIHFLAKYRQELQEQNNDVQAAITRSIQETGFSMIFTFIILFAGFFVFTWSSFTSTYYLGVLTCVTLVVALLANLVLLPSVIISVNKWLGNKTEH